MGPGIPLCSGKVTIHQDPIQEGRTYGDRFPNDESEEAGQGLPEEAEETARVYKKNH